MKKFVILILPLMLSACWTGPDFYAGVPSVQPVPAGTYKVIGVISDFRSVEEKYYSDKEYQYRDRINSTARISYAANHDVIFEGGPDGGGDEGVRLIALDEAKGLYIVQADPGQGVAAIKKRFYGLVQVIPDGFRLSADLCHDTQRIKPGSKVIVGGLFVKRTACSYKDRETFEIALRQFAEDPANYTEYRLVKR